MKKRDRRKLHIALFSLAAIAVTVFSALSATFAALGALLRYVRTMFNEWNENRKAENAARIAAGLEKNPDILVKMRAKFKEMSAKRKEEKKLKKQQEEEEKARDWTSKQAAPVGLVFDK